MTASEDNLVLVTGGTGFVGMNCILKCLAEGYRVRTTVRSLKKENDVRKLLAAAQPFDQDKLTFVEADLIKDDGWHEAVKTCTYVQHVASPFPSDSPAHEDDLIIPAREGTLRVLRAAREAKVRRVVVTSSFAAIGYGHGEVSRQFTEKDWTNLNDPHLGAYPKSKMIAERAAWDFVEREGTTMELSVVNPAGIFGPLLGPDISTSIQLVKRLLDGGVPACADLAFGVVDVRDVADLHFLAMTRPEAKGERFICVSPPIMTILEMSLALKDGLGPAAKKAPTRKMPNYLTRFISYLDPALARLVPELGKRMWASNDKATRALGWHPRTNAEALIATGESLVKLGLVKK